MSNFKTYSRFNKQSATEGVWFEVTDEFENVWGEFRVAYANPFDPNASAIQNRIRHFYKITEKSGHTDIQVGAIMLVERYLKDWKVEDAKGKLIPFSKEAALEYFNNEDMHFILIKLLDFASDVRNYNVEPVADIVKN